LEAEEVSDDHASDVGSEVDEDIGDPTGSGEESANNEPPPKKLRRSRAQRSGSKEV
jgi:hypothetical protein